MVILKLGDVVKLISGGPHMTVEAVCPIPAASDSDGPPIGSDDVRVKCVWWSELGGGQYQRADFLGHELSLITG